MNTADTRESSRLVATTHGAPAGAEASVRLSDVREGVLHAYLQEYDKLWDEVSARFDNQREAFNYVLLIVGAVLTAYTANQRAPYLYLLAPLLVTSLGYIFFDNELMIWSIVHYTRNHLSKQVREITGDPHVFEMEYRRFAYMREGGRLAQQLLSYGRWLVFLLPSLVMMRFALQFPEWWRQPAFCALLAFDCVALLGLAGGMIIAARQQSVWNPVPRADERVVIAPP